MSGGMHAFNNIVSRYFYIIIEMIVAYFNNRSNDDMLKKPTAFQNINIWSKTSLKRFLKRELFFLIFYQPIHT